MRWAWVGLVMFLAFIAIDRPYVGLSYLATAIGLSFVHVFLDVNYRAFQSKEEEVYENP